MHRAVLVKEVLEVLDAKPGAFVIDGTYGAGGHAHKLIQAITPGGTFLGVDWDKTSIEKAKQEHTKITEEQKQGTKVFLVCGNYAELPKILKEHELGKADGILIDLGFSSEQLVGKGFSFNADETLDMRYSETTELRAVDLVNNLNTHDLRKLFWEYGEERASSRIAEAIVKQRKEKPIITARELAQVVESVIPRHGARIHPATKVFQALRIAVNKELDNLKTFLNTIPVMLKPNGRLAIISFHSLEDRIVKQHFIQVSKNNMAKIITKKPVRATQAEIKTNPRSRSAKLRAMQFITKINNS